MGSSVLRSPSEDLPENIVYDDVLSQLSLFQVITEVRLLMRLMTLFGMSEKLSRNAGQSQKKCGCGWQLSKMRLDVWSSSQSNGDGVGGRVVETRENKELDKGREGEYL